MSADPWLHWQLHQHDHTYITHLAMWQREQRRPPISRSLVPLRLRQEGLLHWSWASANAVDSCCCLSCWRERVPTASAFSSRVCTTCKATCLRIISCATGGKQRMAGAVVGQLE